MENLYSIAEVSEYLKVSEITIRRYIKAGKLKSTKIGKQHRITESTIRAFLGTNEESQSEKKGV